MSTFRYKVKFRGGGGRMYYGVVRSYGAEADEHKARGLAIVDDAVLPVAYSVAEADLVDVESEFGRFDHKNDRLVGGDEIVRARADAFEVARKLAATAPDDGKLRVGDLFQIGVADGYAWYVVTKVNKKTCRVEWRHFGGDGYQDHHFGLGGSFPIQDVSRYTEGFKKRERFWAKKGA